MRTAVSLFAGVGGFDLALERAGIRVVASVEWDKKAQEVLKKHFPKSEIFGDIQGVTGEQLRAAGFDPSNGIITGGFPCQDLSVAGKRAGLAGKRSGLFWEICRLLDETRSQTVILENVPGLLSSNNGGDMAVVIEALVERGYRVAWRVLDAQYFGVPQRRRRVFIVGCLGNDRRSPEEILALSESRARYLETSREKRKNTSRSITESAGNSSVLGSNLIGTLAARDYKGIGNQYVSENKIVVNNAVLGSGKDIANTIPASLYHHGTVVNQDANNGHVVVHSKILTIDGTRVGDVRVSDDQTMQTVIQRWGTGGGNVPAIFPIDDARELEKHQNGTGIGEEGAPAYTLDRQQAPAVVKVVESLTPWPEMGEAMRIYGTNGPSPIVKQHQMNILNQSRVRRLTPTECERLQGFPDGWTEGQADSHRYKQMGNAVAVPVVQWLIDRV